MRGGLPFALILLALASCSGREVISNDVTNSDATSFDVQTTTKADAADDAMWIDVRRRDAVRVDAPVELPFNRCRSRNECASTGPESVCETSYPGGLCTNPCVDDNDCGSN